MANTAWEIWKARCRNVFENIKPNTVDTIRSIQLLNESTGKKMLQIQTQDAMIVHNTSISWIPPASPYQSFCCDASFKIVNSIKYVGWGLIHRDFAGNFIHVRCEHANGVLSAAEAKFRGLLEALNVAEELGAQFASFEIDARLVIQAVNENTLSTTWENHSIISDIKHKLTMHPNWTCKYISRKNNLPADKLAKHARIHEVTKMWFDYPPSFIAGAIFEDMANVVISTFN
ncbi:uncharacterized protein LOC113352089 [Papaver somniferum]|uniref:uncharacterized protein LOC113352089 n=1 Tax=Papaver somniferum TaxID=3469 RepID=UPI000E701DB8|nr:uncharacterized protein LOC113352089 [Papaver somniferum]